MPLVADLEPRENLTKEMRGALELMERHLERVREVLATTPRITDEILYKTMADLHGPRLEMWAEFSRMIRAARARLNADQV
jgi:hypothetical protein